MQFIVTALRAEAAPLIRKFGLKQNTSSRIFQRFESKEITLVVSGVGKVLSAIATTWILNQGEQSENSSALNFGLCGCSDRKIPLGSLAVINKITDHGSGRNFYPEVLLRHTSVESSLTTHDAPVFCDDPDNTPTGMADMEASGFFQAAARNLPLERILCLKLVSDYLEPRDFEAKAVEDLVEDRVGEIEQILANGRLPIRNQNHFNSLDEQLLNTIEKNLRLTFTQKRQMHSWALAFVIRNETNLKSLEPFSIRPPVDRRDRNKQLTEIKAILSQ
ncbi:MAG: Futalosine hydrolase [Candidatus Moanabacter tarae]|uniref:Futalosine hydrolase n=1 Tax=Candidatus Moanibacter tarae TaxID=2200854 RepID=A0A2Z4AJZ3_9BACT|nr:MAG: Futalosine hydrolase [Candidatus Moanabacter tarae]|tara:strand:+ start:5455 stop:6282 length:828 start_codon:yes stop_codon:yes gene_type:complete